MTTTRLGWEVANVSLAVKQGSAGSVLLTATVTKADGSALDSYDGWTAKLDLYRVPQDAPEISLIPVVTNNPGLKQFLITISVTGDDTDGKQVGNLVGDVCMTAPNDDEYFPANVTLTIERSYSGV